MMIFFLSREFEWINKFCCSELNQFIYINFFFWKKKYILISLFTNSERTYVNIILIENIIENDKIGHNVLM